MIKQIRAAQFKLDTPRPGRQGGGFDRSSVSNAALAHRPFREFRPLGNLRRSALAGLIALLVVPFVATAAGDEATTAQPATGEERLAAAASMLAESKARLSAAKQLLEQKDLECTAKFLVNSCRNEAYQQYLKSIREARRLENEGKALERQVKKEQVADRERRLIESAPQHEADLQVRQAETEAARQQSEHKAEATRIDKAKRSAAGERRKAAEAEKLRRKQAAHDAQVAAKKQQAAQQAERQQQRQAEHQAAKAAANK